MYTPGSFFSFSIHFSLLPSKTETSELLHLLPKISIASLELVPLPKGFQALSPVFSNRPILSSTPLTMPSPSSILHRLRTLQIGKKDSTSSPSNSSTNNRSNHKESPSGPPSPQSTFSNESNETTTTAEMNHLPPPTRSSNAPPPSSSSNSRSNRKGNEGLAQADKDMEERANRAKELLSMRYRSLRHDQVRSFLSKMHLFLEWSISVASRCF